MQSCGTEKGYRLHLRNKESICGECRETHREISRAHRSENVMKYREANKKYKESHKERLAEAASIYNSSELRKAALKRYRENNLDVIQERGRSAERKRRAVKRQTSHLPYSETDVISNYGTECHICHSLISLESPRKVGVEGWESGLHIDHVLPLSKGGSDLLENVKPAHAICNLRKNGKDLKESQNVF